jgi:hypothetical protein
MRPPAISSPASPPRPRPDLPGSPFRDSSNCHDRSGRNHHRRLEAGFPDLDGDPRHHGLDALLLAQHTQRTEVGVVACQQDTRRQQRCQRGGGRTGKGNPYLKGVPGEAAAAAGKTDTFPGERCRRLVKRRGKLKAWSPSPARS